MTKQPLWKRWWRVVEETSKVVKVLGTLGGAALLVGGLYWGHLRAAAMWVGSTLVTTIPTPVWLLVLLLLLALAGATVAVVLGTTSRSPQHAWWRWYVQDHFKGVDWYWSWRGEGPGGRMVGPDLAAFCPRDSTRLVASSTEWSCETCAGRWPMGIEGDPREGDPRDTIVRQIERKVRTGEWKEVVQRHAAS